MLSPWPGARSQKRVHGRPLPETSPDCQRSRHLSRSPLCRALLQSGERSDEAIALESLPARSRLTREMSAGDRAEGLPVEFSNTPPHLQAALNAYDDASQWPSLSVLAHDEKDLQRQSGWLVDLGDGEAQRILATNKQAHGATSTWLAAMRALPAQHKRSLPLRTALCMLHSPSTLLSCSLATDRARRLRALTGRSALLRCRRCCGSMAQRTRTTSGASGRWAA